MSEDWPTREEWAKERRTLFDDMLPDVSTSLADYAAPSEIASLIDAVQSRGHKGIAHVLEQLRCGELPIRSEDCEGAEDLLAPFQERRARALREAIRRRRAKLASIPIDDAAWNRELERRAKVDAYLNQSESGYDR